MNEFEKSIASFWNYILDKTFNTFDFELFFNDFNSVLEEKLALHGMLSLEDYIHYVSKYYDLDILKQFIYTSKHTDIEFGLEDIQKQIFKPRYNHFKEIYKNDENFKKLLKIYYDLKEQSDIDETKKIFLVDRCIHAEHGHGNIINVDIEKLRYDYENKIDSLSTDKSFGILTRNGLEERISDLSHPFGGVFIDFNSIHSLNQKIGYENVNRRFNQMFSDFDFERCLVGRWFSGDEIVIISNEANRIVVDFQHHTQKYNLNFKSKTFPYCKSLKHLQSMIGEMKWKDD